MLWRRGLGLNAPRKCLAGGPACEGGQSGEGEMGIPRLTVKLTIAKFCPHSWKQSAWLTCA